MRGTYSIRNIHSYESTQEDKYDHHTCRYEIAVEKEAELCD
jgi:hypothetical protein